MYLQLLKARPAFRTWARSDDFPETGRIDSQRALAPSFEVLMADARTRAGSGHPEGAAAL